MPKMRVVLVSRPGGPFEMVEREIPQPGPREVRVKVQACGLCHSDVARQGRAFPGHHLSARPRSRDRPCYRRGRDQKCHDGEIGQHVGVGWLGSCLWALRIMPSRNLHHVCEPAESRASRWMADIRSTCRFRSRDWRSFRSEINPIDACPADVRWHHHVQLAAQQWRARRGHRSCPGHRRARASGHSICRQDGLSHDRHRARYRQRAIGEATGCRTLHRQHRDRSGGRTSACGRRQDHRRNGDEPTGDRRHHRRPLVGRSRRWCSSTTLRRWRSTPAR